MLWLVNMTMNGTGIILIHLPAAPSLCLILGGLQFKLSGRWCIPVRTTVEGKLGLKYP